MVVGKELLKVFDYDDFDGGLVFGESVDGLLVKMGVLLNEIHVTLMSLRVNVKSLDVSMDRFNYQFTDSVFAEVFDGEDDSFRVRVHQDDVEVLDDILNKLVVNYNNVLSANTNLNESINKFNRLIDREISKTDDKYILKLLNKLKEEVI